MDLHPTTMYSTDPGDRLVLHELNKYKSNNYVVLCNQQSTEELGIFYFYGRILTLLLR